MQSSRPAPGSAAPNPRRLLAQGIGLFLFIPLVLFLFVRHPAPVGLSLLMGVLLMLGHRRLARPYMLRALPAKCLWCNRVPPRGTGPGDQPEAGPQTGSTTGPEVLDLAAGPEVHHALCCPGHRRPAGHFFAWLAAGRLGFAAGIFLPLLLLLGALAAAALGERAPLATATALFQLVVGLTVNVAALGPWLGREPAPGTAIPVPFPLHNFFLLGVRALLWIFRLVGVWWIAVGVRALLG
ncbi:MAG TPA: hypothetical protein VEG34_07370 [Thermoanaerobaculia bacterium]|nr:hypothetical protein [Thermoanaerobaculia bacterium]